MSNARSAASLATTSVARLAAYLCALTVLLHDLVEDFQFADDFYGQGMAPLGPGQNSVHFANTQASGAMMRTRFT